MGKIVRYLIFLLFVVSLFGSEVDDILSTADTKSASSNYKELIDSHRLYKKAYLKAKRQKSKYLIWQSLTGIIETGSKLKFDVNSFDRELKNYPIAVLNKYTINEQKIVLDFDRALNDDDYYSFALDQKDAFRQVIDIFAMFSHDFKGADEANVRVAKYKRAITRVVLSNDKKFKIKLSTWKNYLIIQTDKNFDQEKKETSKTPEQTPKKNIVEKNDYRKDRIVVLDPGHGGKDSGAIGYKGLTEKEVVYAITKKLARLLKDRGYRVYITRNEENFVALSKRTKMANNEKAQIFVSIHANANPKKSANGIETYFLSPARTSRAKDVAAKENSVDLEGMNYNSQQTFLNFLNREKVVSSNKLAIDIQKNILDKLRDNYSGVRDAGVREGPFWVLVGAQMPSVLIEVGFVTNPQEARRLENSQYQYSIAMGIANGIDSYFYYNQ